MAPPRLDECRNPIPPAALVDRLVFQFLERLRFRELFGLKPLNVVVPTIAGIDPLTLPVLALVCDPNVGGFRSLIDACHVLVTLRIYSATKARFLSHFAPIC